MTQRLPLVLGADNTPQQLQTGDTISVAMNTPTIRPVTNGEASTAIVFATPVYAAAADSVKRAQANAKTTSKLAGLVYDPSIAAGAVGNICFGGIMVGTTAQWDAVVTGETGGLITGTYYFLDPTNIGKLTPSPSFTNGSGQCNTYIGEALSTTELEVQIALPILL